MKSFWKKYQHSFPFRIAIFVIFSFLCFKVAIKPTDGLNFCKHNDTALRLINNGYETLIIWVGEEVEEDFTLISELEDLISRFSATMYNLTKRRAFIRNVEILLPSKWGIPPADFKHKISGESIHDESKDLAQIWLKNSTSYRNTDNRTAWKKGDSSALVFPPYVIKTTPCGFPGAYLRISPEFILFGNMEPIENVFGSQEKVIAREWAKLRWGVYDELPREIDPSNFYLHSDLSIKPTICSSAIPDNNVNGQSNTDCEPLTRNEMPGKNCLFEPSRAPQSQSYASLLYRADLDYVEDFCDEEGMTTIPQTHDNEAPTVHNLHCRGRSIWKVMREHPDFANGNNPPMQAKSPPPINFTIVQDSNRRVVLALDVSSSMLLDGKLQSMRQAVGHFIDNIAEDSWVGIVCFSWRAQTKINLTQVRNEDVREHLKKRLSLSTSAGTSIGSGILQAIEVLKESGPTQVRGRGGTIILLTDGKEHIQPKINNTIKQVISSQVTINTIALGTAVAGDLEILASVSNGKTFAASSGQFGRESELLEAFSSLQEDGDVGLIPIISEKVIVPANSTITAVFIIDDTIGKNTRISIFYDKLVEPLVILKSPSVMIYNETEKSNTILYKHEEMFQKIYIHINSDAQVGNWTLHFQNPLQNQEMNLQVNVGSYQRSKDPIIVSPALLCRVLDFSGFETVVVYAYLSEGELAVLSARVLAEITRPLSPSQNIFDSRFIFLRDNGLDPDVTANDGVYSAYFTDFTSTGRYNVKVFADDNNRKAYLDTDYILGIGKFRQAPITVDTRFVVQPSNTSRSKREAKSRNRRAIFTRLPSFERVSSAAGSFLLQNWQADDICESGYTHFQDSCYKVFHTPLSYDEGMDTCERQGGTLAVLDSRQEMAWLLERITPVNNKASAAWFGRISNELRKTEKLEIERLLPRIRRGNDDHDLHEIAASIRAGTMGEHTEQLIESFDPDLKDLSNAEINRLLAKLGLDSREDLYNLRDIMTPQIPSPQERRKRQASLLGNAISPEFPFASNSQQNLGNPEQTSNILPVTTTSYSEENSTKTETKQLSQAKKEPKKPDFVSNGNITHGCSWFQSGKIIESDGSVCEKRRKFICEKQKKDRFPPSRIIDLKGKFFPENDTLRLTWSAPGDDLTKGRAVSYDIRSLGTNQAVQVLNSDFERGEALPMKKFNDLDNFPSNAGERETVTLNISSNLVCPPNAVLDVIFALQPSGYGTSGTYPKKKLTLKLIDNILSQFDIGVFDVQIAAFALNNFFSTLFDFEENLNATQIGKRLNEIDVSSTSKRSIKEAVTSLLDRGSRKDASKILLAITDDQIKYFSNLTDVSKMIVTMNNRIEKPLLWEIASQPGCKNSFIVEDIDLLPNIADQVIQQLCKMRITEFQAVAVEAIDDQGQRGDPSNVFRFVVPHYKVNTTCPEITPEPAPAVAGPSLTIGLSIGVPVFAILSIIGAVMLVGQIKKYRKKRREKKIQKEQQERLQKIRENKRRKAAIPGTSGEPSQSAGNINNNNSQRPKMKLFGRWRTAPINDPPV